MAAAATGQVETPSTEAGRLMTRRPQPSNIRRVIPRYKMRCLLMIEMDRNLQSYCRACTVDLVSLAYFTTQFLVSPFSMGNCFSSPSDGTGKSSGHRGSSHELRSYEPVRYLSDRAQARSLPVQCVHFVAHSVLQNGGNHWTMFLQASPSRSVRINMDPSEVRGAPAPGHGYRGLWKSVSENTTSAGTGIK